MALSTVAGPVTSPQQLAEWVARFEKAWESATPADGPPDLGLFLPPPENSLRGEVLRALIAIDLAKRWLGHQPILLEVYLERYPELKAATPHLAALLQEEYRIRHEFGDKPDRAVYQARFPEQFPEMLRLIDEQIYKTVATASVPNVTPTMSAPPPPMEVGKSAVLGGRDGILPVGQGYRLLKRIGSGSFGEVWRAAAPGGVEVAIKIILRPIDHEEAQRELQALELIKRLRHPYLADTQAYWPLEDRLLIVMELADGSLSSRLKECKSAGLMGIPVEELLGYFHEAAEALDFLHGENVQHRDIKPDNILLLQRHAKVADFGMARLQDNIRMANATACGTPAYMAPEVWRGKMSRHSDQYSLAMTYIELRLGRPPFPATNMVQVMEGHIKEQPDLTPLSEAEQQVILKAVAKDPEQRYPNCREFIAALEQVLVPALRPAAPEPLPAYKRWLWLLASGAVGLLVVLAAWLFLKPEAGFFEVEPPAPLAVAMGQTDRFTLHLPRHHFTEPVTVSFKNLPAGVQIPDLMLPAGEETMPVEVVVAPKARAGIHYVTVQAESGDRRTEAALELTILFLPAGAEKATDEIVGDLNGRKYFRRILCRVPGDEAPFEFVVVPKLAKDDPDTFYMLRDKVSVGHYRKFAQAQGERLIPKEWTELKLTDDHPALGVGVEDAYHFAADWLHGNLPTAQQWDKAAGVYQREGREGPYKGAWKSDAKLQIAVARQTPLPVGRAVDDESPFGCRDMAGNGMEWTRDLASSNLKVPVGAPEKKEASVVLRGRSYFAPDPFRYSDLDGSNSSKGGILPYEETMPAELGFRVVVTPE